jgi:hypothetical protein
MSRPLSDDERAFLVQMNRASLENSFVPATDVDWNARTTDDEYAALYDVWSLLKGSGRDDPLGRQERIDFARYQQANLMGFTAMLERYGLRALERLYEHEHDLDLVDALAHFAKEETYHHQMFLRAIAKLEAEMPTRPKLPMRHVAWFLRVVFLVLGLIPSARLRTSTTFVMLQFAEEISVLAHAVGAGAVPRKESFCQRVWALHALDEGRHLRFDAFMRARYALPAPFARLPVIVAAPLAAISSALLNANDVWAARQVGARVGLRHLPSLVASTTAPFKRRVFASITKLLGGSA